MTMNDSQAGISAKKNKIGYCGSCGNVWNIQWKFCKFCGSVSSNEKHIESKALNKIDAKTVAVPRGKKILNKWFWDIHSKESAMKAVSQAYIVSYAIATITTIFVLISLATGESVGGINEWAIFDALLFALAGIGIQFYSRAAAVIALTLFLIEKIFMILEGQINVIGGLLAIVFTVFLVNGVRGTYVYQRSKFLNAS